jgi:hypothetical protein
MKWAILFLLIISVWADLPAGALAQAGFIELVKGTRNSLGQYCGEIPRVIETRLGYKTLKSHWLENKMNGEAQVFLKVKAQKEVRVDSLYVSYAWNPEWVWKVKGYKNVTPANALARNWMAGKI